MARLGSNETVFCTPPFGERFLDLIEPAGAAGFSAMSISPPAIWALRERGVGLAEIRNRLADAGRALAEVDAVVAWMPIEGRSCFLGSDIVPMLSRLSPEAVIADAAELGARSVTVVDMFKPNCDVEQAADAFAGICELAAAHGLLVHIEFMAAGGIPDLTTAWDIVRRAGQPNGGITIDTLHFFRSGSTLEQLRAIPPERIMTVQLADAPAAPPADLTTELMLGRLNPGEGQLDLAGVIGVLDEIGADVPIGVEIFSADLQSRPVAATAERWMRGIQSTIQAAGRDQRGSNDAA